MQPSALAAEATAEARTALCRFRAECVCGGRLLAATIPPVADPENQPLNEQLEEIGAQLDWVRDYL